MAPLTLGQILVHARRRATTEHRREWRLLWRAGRLPLETRCTTFQNAMQQRDWILERFLIDPLQVEVIPDWGVAYRICREEAAVKPWLYGLIKASETSGSSASSIS